MADEVVHVSFEVGIPYVIEYPARVDREQSPATLNANTNAAGRYSHVQNTLGHLTSLGHIGVERIAELGKSTFTLPMKDTFGRH